MRLALVASRSRAHDAQCFRGFANRAGARAVVSRIGNEWTAPKLFTRLLLSTKSADAIVLHSVADHADMGLHESIEVFERTQLIVGCATAFGILAARARRRWCHVASRGR